MQQALAHIYLIGFAVIACLLLAAWLLIAASGGRLQPSRVRHLHRNETGSVQSLSFVLALPLFIMTMMGIVQASQIMIAQIVVEYAAVTAARCAAVWIPSHFAGSPTDGRNRISRISPAGAAEGGNYYTIDVRDPGGAYLSPKTFRIAMAAAQACVPICPSRDTGCSIQQPGGGAHAAMVKAYGALVPANEGDGAISRRLKNKLAYSLTHTTIRIRAFHPGSEPPLQQIYEDVDQFDGIYVTGMLSSGDGGQPMPVYHPDFDEDSREFQANELGWQDEITVVVHHDLALLPGPGRLLSKWVYSREGSRDTISETIERKDDLYTWPLKAGATISNEGQKSVIRYEHQMSGMPY